MGELPGEGDERSPIPAAAIEAEMAAFHAAARRRKIRILASAAVVLVLVGVVAGAIGLSADAPRTRVWGGKWKAIGAAIGALVFGLRLGVKAVRVARGTVIDAVDEDGRVADHGAFRAPVDPSEGASRGG